MPEHAYGWRPDGPDHNDYIYRSPYAAALLPPKVDLRDSYMPEVEDQSQLGACTSFGLGAAFMYDRALHGKPTFTPSHLFIYYGERAIEHTTASDAGAMIRDGAKVLGTLGAPPEADWAYDISKFAKKPPAKAYSDALQHRAGAYHRVSQVGTEIKGALAARKLVVVGITVYESMESVAVERTGAVPMPKRGEKALGGHCIACCGYDDTTGLWLLRNSWGTSFGDHGYFTLPQEYLLNPKLSSDFWTIEGIP